MYINIRARRKTRRFVRAHRRQIIVVVLFIAKTKRSAFCLQSRFDRCAMRTRRRRTTHFERREKFGTMVRFSRRWWLERERKKEREKSKHRNALLAYHGSGPGHPVPSPSRDRLHFPRSFVVSLRLSVKVLFVCVCKRSRKEWILWAFSVRIFP